MIIQKRKGQTEVFIALMMIIIGLLFVSVYSSIGNSQTYVPLRGNSPSYTYSTCPTSSGTQEYVYGNTSSGFQCSLTPSGSGGVTSINSTSGAIGLHSSPNSITITTGSLINFVINLAHTNIWTALQEFNYLAFVGSNTAPCSQNSCIFASSTGSILNLQSNTIDYNGADSSIIVFKLCTGCGQGYGVISMYNDQITAGQGIPSIVKQTVEKSETGSDTNVLTYACTSVSSTNNLLQINTNIDVSAISSGTITVTVAWKDSKSNSNTYTTITDSSTGGYSGGLPQIDCKYNTNVVISTTFAGTSTTYDISATVLRFY